MFTIRPARPEDAPAIAHVHVESWRSTYAGIVPAPYLASLDVAERTAMWRAWLAGSSPVLTAVQEDRVIGFASGGVARDAALACDGELYALYLLSEEQRKGIGTALFGELQRRLVRLGFQSMALWVLESNPARRFYEARGGQFCASKPIEIGGANLVEVAYVWRRLPD